MPTAAFYSSFGSHFFAAAFGAPEGVALELPRHAAVPHDWDQLTVRQQVNAMEYIAQFEAMLRAGTAQGEIAVVDVARDPLRAMESCVVVDKTNTLRTNNAHLWLIPGPSVQAQLGVRGRLLNRDEKSRLAGVRPESMSDLTRVELEEAVGNTIPVSLIGSVLFPLLRAWVEAQSAIAQPTVW